MSNQNQNQNTNSNQGNEAGFIIDTPEGIAVFQLLTARRALAFEVKTGMKLTRGNTLQFVQRQYGIKSRTKKGALAELNAIIDQLPQSNTNEQPQEKGGS